jgi:site-specific DNA-methyltransferase (adenine-specific)
MEPLCVVLRDPPGGSVTPYYSDDAVTIYHGDCREIATSIEADAVVTDPPYGVGMTAFDDDFGVGIEGLLASPGERAAIFMSPRRCFDFAQSMSPSWPVKRMLWMHKRADIAAPWRGWCMNSEAILIADRGGVWPEQTDYRSDVYEVGPWERGWNHPNAKPLTVVTDLVRRLTRKRVLDPFMGSGTTLRAAKDLGRKAIGIEIEERYCEIAAKRCAQEVLSFGAVLVPEGGA